MDSAGVDAYRRILDLSYASLDLTLDDTRALVRRLTDGGPARGPFALVVAPALAAELAERVRRLIEQDGGDRRTPAVQVFAASDGARDWLASLARPGGAH